VSPPARPGLPGVTLVFVQSKDGNTGAADPSALGGGETDLHLIYEGLSRVAVDGVLAGSGTLCASKIVLSVWHPQLVALRAELGLPRHPAQIILSDVRLDLSREPFANIPDLPVFVMTTPRGHDRMRATFHERPWIKPVVMTPDAGIAGALREIAHDHAIRRISCVGGATPATTLIDAGVVSDLYLTTGATAGGEPDTPFYRGARPPERLPIVR
jgi:riboflavin biosynthesis pyrimidine reductase